MRLLENENVRLGLMVYPFFIIDGLPLLFSIRFMLKTMWSGLRWSPLGSHDSQSAIRDWRRRTTPDRSSH